MKHSASLVRAFLFLPLLCIAWHQGRSQEKPQEKSKETAAAPKSANSNAPERKNPVKPTPENLAEAKKFFSYDCAMCHGATGDGKGDLAPSMGLKMNDWRDRDHGRWHEDNGKHKGWYKKDHDDHDRD